MRTKNQVRPTYKYQTQRHLWQPRLKWESSWGLCSAIAKHSNNTFSVLVEQHEKTQWLPVELILSEADVIAWIRKNKF